MADGAARSYLAALFSVVSHSLATLARLASGLLLGGALGGVLGLAVSWSPWSRRLVELPTQFLRALPLLAMVPLFQLWFGTYFFGQVLFVAYGVGMIVFAGVVNAVRNVPQIYIDNARALGASRVQLYRTVVLPAILPAMRSIVLLSLGAGWGAVLAAEYLGAQSGLGYIIVYAQQFGLLDRMFLIALLFIVYTSASYWAIERLFARLLAWAPPAQSAPMRPPVHDQSARALVTRMRGGETSAVAVMTAFLERIAAREGEVRAFAFLDPAAALAAAERCDAAMAAGGAAGPLHGLPVAVKDIIDTADMPTEYGGEIFAGRRPARDATIVRRLRNAGAVVLGKTVTSQYALFVPGPTRNPHDLAHTPGGSSSGSAAAVAANFAPVALGTQTNGSVIRPASYCGIVGFKPSLGLLPRTGVLRHAALIDHPGVLARDVADAALIVDADRRRGSGRTRCRATRRARSAAPRSTTRRRLGLLSPSGRSSRAPSPPPAMR